MKLSGFTHSALAFFATSAEAMRISCPRYPVQFMQNHEYAMLTAVIESEVSTLPIPDDDQQQQFIDFLQTVSFYDDIANTPDFWGNGVNFGINIKSISQMRDIPAFRIPNAILESLYVDTSLFKPANEAIVRDAFSGKMFDLDNTIDMLNLQFMITTLNQVQSFDITHIDTTNPLMYRRAYPNEYALISLNSPSKSTFPLDDEYTSHQIPVQAIRENIDNPHRYQMLEALIPFSLAEDKDMMLNTLKKKLHFLDERVLTLLQKKHSAIMDGSVQNVGRMIPIEGTKFLRLDKIPVFAYGNKILGSWLNGLNASPLNAQTKRVLTVVNKVGRSLNELQTFDQEIQMLCEQHQSKGKSNILDVSVHQGFPMLQDKEQEKTASLVVNSP
ncbi:MAG: hypothetical protein P1U61_02455 [Legionellaceae bacterium]|nr:hypothetical protein [Legionellaceae bacterium]